MSLSPISKDQLVKIAKAAVYVGLSAVLDFLISQSTDTQFGVLTPVINVALVTVKQAFTTPSEQ